MKYEHTAIAIKDQRKVIPINSIHIPVMDVGLFVVASCTDTLTIIIRKTKKYVKKTAKIEIMSSSHAISFCRISKDGNILTSLVNTDFWTPE